MKVNHISVTKVLVNKYIHPCINLLKLRKIKPSKSSKFTKKILLPLLSIKPSPHQRERVFRKRNFLTQETKNNKLKRQAATTAATVVVLHNK